MSGTFAFRGFDIPVDLMLLTGGGPDTFQTISDEHMRELDSQFPLRAGLRVLELGCGIGRDAIPLAEIIGPTGSYVGVDIIKPSIDWCKSAITARYPWMHFVHHDVADRLHNPAGAILYTSVHLPPANGSVDLVVAQSVFTHMLEDAVRHYLCEFARIIEPDGVVYATSFVVCDKILAKVRAQPVTVFDLSFRHALGDGCYVNELEYLTGAVAYTEPALARMVSAAGLEFARPILPGAWPGFHPQPFAGQDVMVLRRVRG
jgi:ubiquinone/menaquinone biosynthesis C-methylase UbiE